MGCRRCTDPELYVRLDRLADDFPRHAALFRCPRCGSLYELFPEEKRPATELTEAEARARFPGAGTQDPPDGGARVQRFQWTLGDRVIRWRWGEEEITKEFSDEIGSALVLRDASGVAVVAPDADLGPSNAVIYEANGAERARVALPRPDQHVMFQQMYYVGDELTAIAITRGSDWAAVVDPWSGRSVRTYETR